jgi:hypothetical protein
MMHDKRRWGVGPVPSPEELARKLTESTWTLCTGFYVEGHPEFLFLNDATSEDGGQEYAVVKGGLDAKEHIQIESITMSWCSKEEAMAYIHQALAGEMDHSDFAHRVHPRLEPIEKHKRCHLCA